MTGALDDCRSFGREPALPLNSLGSDGAERWAALKYIFHVALEPKLRGKKIGSDGPIG
jgi:hypothetical protein